MLEKLIFLFFALFFSEIIVAADEMSEDYFRDKITNLRREKDSGRLNEGEFTQKVWQCVYAPDMEKKTVITNRLMDIYEKFPLITEYQKVPEVNEAYVTITFKCQCACDKFYNSKSCHNPHQSHEKCACDHAGLVLEFIRNGRVEANYYDLAIKRVQNGEQSQKSCGETVSGSGASGDYCVRKRPSDFIITQFLWAPEPPHNEVSYFIYKTFQVDMKTLNSLKLRLDNDHNSSSGSRASFPYTLTGKWYHNCITYVAHVLEDAGVARRSSVGWKSWSCSFLYYDANWLKDLADSVKNGRKAINYRDSSYKDFIYSDAIQRRVLSHLIMLITAKSAPYAPKETKSCVNQ